MAKISSVEKNKKRRKLVKQYAPKREALKGLARGASATDYRDRTDRF